MKTFIRVGSFYRAEAPLLQDDLDISELGKQVPQTQIQSAAPVICNCKNDIAALHERIDVLTEFVHTTELFAKEKIVHTLKEETAFENNLSSLKDNKPASVPAKKSVPKKPVAKKAAAKKK